ncbi:hypothetical protein KIN20_023054 [Parelaphostrongylus tenuis]|uniref:Uncharacterized protein n=1 Tax=Parelaphostrongylus tenuis TaxID=148309 RepID=A0AAD5N6R3_PARTN|nr:hypothetical protein KIN20_023054 [Parelaphostrongylus tenuis]
MCLFVRLWGGAGPKVEGAAQHSYRSTAPRQVTCEVRTLSLNFVCRTLEVVHSYLSVPSAQESPSKMFIGYMIKTDDKVSSTYSE